MRVCLCVEEDLEKANVPHENHHFKIKGTAMCTVIQVKGEILRHPFLRGSMGLGVKAAMEKEILVQPS